MTIAPWLIEAAKQLKNIGIESSRLDAEIILAHTLRKSRTWLHAHGDETLELRILEIADARLELRKDFTPIAYIIGHKEFYGRKFIVSPSTLIPRPESEMLIDLLKKHLDTAKLFDQQILVDVGTGSGCLGITAKLELPELRVTCADISRHALTITRKNADALEANVQTIESNLLANIAVQPDYLIANLPYVDPSWYRNAETDYEPELALFSDDDGLSLIKKLLVQASNQLAEHGLIILEADPRQHEQIADFAQNHGFTERDRDGYGIVFARKN